MTKQYEGWNPKLVKLWVERCVGRCLVNEDYRLCFLFVSKNASSSMKRALGSCDMLSLKYPDQRNIIEQCTIFTIIREPFSRFVSAYSEVCKLRKDDPQSRQISLHLPWVRIKDPIARFEQFILDIKNNLYDLHLIPQYTHIHDSGLGVDEWITFENLDKQLSEFMQMQGLSCSLPKRNANVDRQQSERLLLLLRKNHRYGDVIREIYAEDFKLYDEYARH